MLRERPAGRSGFEAGVRRRAGSVSYEGELIFPGDEEYEAARQVWNPRFDRRPAVVARCGNQRDIVAALQLAREFELGVAVRGSGHSGAGYSTCDGGIVIDLSRMKGLTVDPERRVAFAEPGLTWGELVDATSEHGLAAVGGLVSQVGIGGLTLGGGIGWLVRSHGLACDSLIEADVVTADGRVVRASEDENADLLWGLRGGGGNFGIVSRFGFKLHPIGSLTAGAVIHPAERAGDVLRFYREFCSLAPDTVNVFAMLGTAPPQPFVPASLRGQPAIQLIVSCVEPVVDAERVLAPLREFGPPAVDLLSPMSFAELQHWFDESASQRAFVVMRSELLSPLEDAALDALVEHTAEMPSPISFVGVRPLGGAVRAVPADATAYSHRDAEYNLEIFGRWESPQEDAEPYDRWAEGCWQALRPWSAGVDINHLADEGSARVREAYGERTYARLAALKRAYDPENLFRLNANIEPS